MTEGPWEVRVEPLTGRSFLTWGGHNAFEVKLTGYAEQAASRLNAHGWLVAALRETERLISESHGRPRAMREAMQAECLRQVRVALEKAGE